VIICLRLVSPELEGAWMQIYPGKTPQFLINGFDTITMVPTGSVEWSGQQCAEVWVPENKLNLWKMEHAIDADAR
jgi:hypothetical protein